MLNLPIPPRVFDEEVISPALAMLPLKMDMPKARLLLITIALQESGLANRWQVIDKSKPFMKGPARGLFQFESGGGVKGVMTHHATAGHAHRICAERGVPWERPNVWAALEQDDLLAVCFARLLLFSDPKPLPMVGEVKAAWNLYERTWRPGRPHPETWPGYYDEARAALGI